MSLTQEANDEGLRRPVVRPGKDVPRNREPDADAEAGTDESWAVWPHLIMLPDGGFLGGVETRLSTSYSGGGGSATQLRLFRVSETGEASGRPVLDLPVSGSLLIRACFSEADLRKRGEACHDEYGFTAEVGVEPTDGQLPSLRYATKAWAFPRGASRDEDSTTRGPLTPADLVREADPSCSFNRRFTFDGTRGTYQPDRPLPDCSAYTVP